MTTSVRWKLPLAATVLLLQLIALTNSAKMESMVSADDGWRPIVGNQRDGPRDEITHYRNPASKKADPVKAEKLTKPVEIPMKLTTNNIPSSSNVSPIPKIAPHNKPVFLLPSVGMHNPQIIPMSAMAMHHRPIKYISNSHLMKLHHHAKPPMPGRMKPLRHPIPSFSTRDEVFVPAPSSNVGPYTFYSGQPLKRPQHQPQHIDFTNHFPIPNSEDELYQLVRAPVHQYVIPKTPISNDVHYTFQNPDEFNRTPQQSSIPYKFESTKEKVKKVKEVPRQETLLQNVGFHVTTPVPSKPVEVHVTKEKLKVFHNSIPPNYSPIQEFEYRPVKSTVTQKRPATYEVTEGKWNHETPTFQYQFTSPAKNRLPTRVFTEETKPFLPTPVKPDSVPPTLPTESEISTIYNQVKLNRQNALPSRVEFSTPTPINFFDVKEVSTHYPILGPPEFQTIAYPPSRYQYNEKENEITTRIVERPVEVYPQPEQQQEVQPIETTTQYIPTIRPQRPNRRPNRRRRPTSTTTTEEEVVAVDNVTENYEVQKIEAVETTTFPQRQRIPSRYRSRPTTTTTMQTPEESTATVIRHHQRQRRPRPTTTTTTEEPVESVEIPTNHKTEYESIEDKFSRLTTTTEKDFPANFESHFTAPYRGEPQTEVYESATEIPELVYRPNRLYTNPPNREEKPVEVVESEEEEESASVEVQSEEVQKDSEEKNLDDIQEMYHHSQSYESAQPDVSINTPENEVDFTTRRPIYTTRQPIEELTTTEITTTPILTTPTTTTTTTSTTTELPKRIRGRPIKYDHNNRPRFSVKDYKQRLTTSTTSTELPPRPVPTNDMRLRFPHRSRRPITPSPTTTPTPDTEEDTPIQTKRFQPKDPRHPNENGSEKPKFATVNTRIRPFGRFKLTTEPTTTTVRVSIKPNIFGNLRRPTPISLKSRILNRQRTNTTSTSTEKPEVTTLDNNLDDANENQSDQTEVVETTIPYSIEETDETAISADFGVKSTKIDVATTIIYTTTTQAPLPEVKHDDFMQSQIVSELTSSAKNEYNKPGLFKNVQPNSRKVPSYFTLATDDPILPIEAFFPNLKDKQ